MHLLGLILLASGGGIGLVFGVQLFLAAFRVSTWWGLG
jgi:hypothetical protein